MFKKGESGNPKGKPKGSKNKTSEEVRTLLLEFVNTNLKTLQVEYNKLEGEKKLLYLEKLFRHILPRPLNELERLTDEQLDELIERLKNKSNE